MKRAGLCARCGILWREPNAIDKLAEELGQGDKDKLHRIHGTNEPWTIGTNVSSGCIRLTNDDITDFYNHTPVASTARPQSFDRSIKTTREPITRRWNFQTAKSFF
jgi:L,D-transpeptidase catalytic domain